MNEDFAPISDLITLVANEQHAEATPIIHDLLGARVLDAMQGFKQEIAQSLFAPLQEESEQLEEMQTRKDFQQVADVIRAHPDAKKRQELAAHHAAIFKTNNPRFDHKRFYAAANATMAEEVQQLDEKKKEYEKSGKKAGFMSKSGKFLFKKFSHKKSRPDKSGDQE